VFDVQRVYLELLEVDWSFWEYAVIEHNCGSLTLVHLLLFYSIFNWFETPCVRNVISFIWLHCINASEIECVVIQWINLWVVNLGIWMLREDYWVQRCISLFWVMTLSFWVCKGFIGCKDTFCVSLNCVWGIRGTRVLLS